MCLATQCRGNRRACFGQHARHRPGEPLLQALAPVHASAIIAMMAYHALPPQGTPIMIGGGGLAYTLLGIDYNELTGACAFLVRPHAAFP